LLFVFEKIFLVREIEFFFLNILKFLFVHLRLVISLNKYALDLITNRIISPRTLDELSNVYIEPSSVII